MKNKKLVVAVLMGGCSIESEVSFNSGRTICDHLDTALYTVFPIFQAKSGKLYVLPWHFLHRGKTTDFTHRLDAEARCISWDELPELIDIVYLALHGRYAEDGVVQGVLELLGIPYVGSKILASSWAMDKYRLQVFLSQYGYLVPETVLVTEDEIKKIFLGRLLKPEAKEAIARLGYPVIVKPAHEGSSLGVSLVNNEEALISALQHAATIDKNFLQAVLVQEKIIGREFVVVCLQKTDGSWFSLPITEIIPEKERHFYDYEQKYMPGRARKITPAPFTSDLTERLYTSCQEIAKKLDCATIVRIDGFVTYDEKIIILDVNTLPGTAPASFIFHQAAAYGMNHTALINYVIKQELSSLGAHVMHAGEASDQIVQQEKLRVAVLLGGVTHEREISLESGRNICYKLSPEKYEVTTLFVTSKEYLALDKKTQFKRESLALYKLLPWQLVQNSTQEIEATLSEKDRLNWSDLPDFFDFIFIGLHGGAGENGAVQGMLEMLGLPYNGSGVHASALCMDKIKSCAFLRAAGFSVPQQEIVLISDWVLLACEQKLVYAQGVFERLSSPVIIKPHDDGCSVFVAKVENEQALVLALENFFTQEKKVALIEEYIVGTELTCGVLGDTDPLVMPPTEVVRSAAILTIEEKFLPGYGENQTPARLTQEVLSFVRETIKNIYAVLGCEGYARIDCFYQDAGQSPTGAARVVFIEANTLPGMTPATCIFHQAAEIGLRPMEFIDRIVQDSLLRHQARRCRFEDSSPGGDAQFGGELLNHDQVRGSRQKILSF